MASKCFTKACNITVFHWHHQFFNYLTKTLREKCPNTELLLVRISGPSEYKKIRTRKNSVFGQFSCSETYQEQSRSFQEMIKYWLQYNYW